MTTSPRIAVIIPTFNRVQTLLACLESVYAQSALSIQAIVVNDGSKDGTTPQVQAAFPQAQIVEGDGNLWWAGAINAGLRQALAAEFDYFLLLNDDNLLAPGAVQNLLSYAETHPGTIVGSLVRLKDTDLISDAGVALNWWRAGPYLKDFKQPYFPGKYPAVIPADALAGQGVLLSREHLNRTGLLHARQFPQYFGDTDFYLRARATGLQVVVNTASAVWNNPPNRPKTLRPANFKEAVSRFVRLYTWPGSPYNLAVNARFWWRYCPKYMLPVTAIYRFLSSLRYFIKKNF
jgi:GT2 family glycosyltransferase